MKWKLGKASKGKRQGTKPPHKGIKERPDALSSPKAQDGSAVISAIGSRSNLDSKVELLLA